jgi:para-aminobenzoate synthetase component I
LRTVKHIVIDGVSEFKTHLLRWSQQFQEVVWLDSNANDNLHNRRYPLFDNLLAVDALTSVKTDYHGAFDSLEEYRTTTGDWIFGYLTYDLKNDLEPLTSGNFDGLHFPDLYFFQPKKLFFITGETLELHYLHFVADEMEDDIKEIMAFKAESTKGKKPSIHSRISKEAYITKVQKMLQHIQLGDIYEANFCQEFFAENAVIDPFETFEKLNAISAPPFATFVKLEGYYLLSASPERYLKKEKQKIISQPIKGTARRAVSLEEDTALAEALKADPKERSENIMITDLVRNDLSRTATKGSVAVEELCGLYTFKQVHQLITTITSTVSEETTITDVLKTTFPMGSMTGAPKTSAMKIIEALEETKRGLYSGSVGYISPEGDADFNVIIRSILYNEENKYLSFSVGSAITSLSQPEKEYEECLLKAKAMREVLS